jgi:hypothetical protein
MGKTELATERAAALRRRSILNFRRIALSVLLFRAVREAADAARAQLNSRGSAFTFI